MSTYIMHHGIRGQKWGVRRFQDAAGELTAAGKARYLEKRKRRDDENGIVRDNYDSGRNWHNANVAEKKRFNNTDRGINASRKHRIAHGKALVESGETTGKRILKRFGAGLLRGTITGITGGVANTVLTGQVMSENPNAKIIAGANAAKVAIGVADTYYGVKNLVGLYQDIVDMNEYKRSDEYKKSRRR